MTQPPTLTTADLVVLSLLSERAMHGYDLLAEYRRQEVVDWASVSKAQVYYALRKLDDSGLIAGKVEENGARDRVVYAPTDAGSAALKHALATGPWASMRVAQPFATWFGLSIHLDQAMLTQQITTRRTFLLAEIARETQSLAFIATLNSARARKGEAIVRLVIAQLQAERAWLDTL
jgi:DNA-binding PadR family transcriptional regulator